MGATVTSGSLWKMLGLAWCWKWRKFHQWAEKPCGGGGGAQRGAGPCAPCARPTSAPGHAPPAAPSPSAVPSRTAGPHGSSGTS